MGMLCLAHATELCLTKNYDRTSANTLQICLAERLATQHGMPGLLLTLTGVFNGHAVSGSAHH